MIDLLDILVPEIFTAAPVEIRRRESAFGLDDERIVYLRDVRLGKLLPATVAYSDVDFWTGSPSRSNWDVLVMAAAANDAATSEETWQRFLSAFAFLLNLHSVWRVNCESDCDQHDLEALELSPEELAVRIAATRSGLGPPVALRASPPPR